MLRQHFHDELAERGAAVVVPLPLRERVRRVLHVHVEPMPAVGALTVAPRLEIRCTRDAPVFRVIVRALEVVERGRHDQRREAGRLVERERDARDDAPAADVAVARGRAPGPASRDPPARATSACGSAPETTSAAAISSPLASTTPVTRPSRTTITADVGAAAYFDAGQVAQHAPYVRETADGKRRVGYRRDDGAAGTPCRRTAVPGTGA